MALGIIRQARLEIGDELRTLGPRADEAHLALEHAPRLGQLVDADLADEAADAGHPGIVLLRPHRLAAHFGIGPHGAQLDDLERLAIEADPALPVKGRAPALQLHRDRRRGDDRPGQRENEEADRNVEQPFPHSRKSAARGKSVREDQPGRVEAIEIDPPRFPLEEGREIIDFDPRRLDPQQIGERQRVAPLLKRENDLAGANPFKVTGKILDGGAVDGTVDRARAVVHANKANDREAGIRPPRERLDPRRARTRSEHQHAAPEAGPAKPVAKRSPDRDHRGKREAGGVEQARSPEGHWRKGGEEKAEQYDAKRGRDDDPRSRKAHRVVRLRAINPDGHHRALQRRCEGDHVRNPVRDRAARDPDLPEPQGPARLGAGEQQGEIDRPQQQHRIGHIMFEQPDHAFASPAVPRTVKASDTLRVSEKLTKKA